MPAKKWTKAQVKALTTQIVSTKKKISKIEDKGPIEMSSKWNELERLKKLEEKLQEQWQEAHPEKPAQGVYDSHWVEKKLTELRTVSGKALKKIYETFKIVH